MRKQCFAMRNALSFCSSFNQELLALEERIGNVNTGLSEEKIIKCLKRRKYFSISSETLEEIEPCCVCQVLSKSYFCFSYN